jgi:long-subunit acyl-CoA synthetase (AMP-forming)
MLPEDLRKRADGGDKESINAALEALLAEVNKTVEHHERLAFLAVAKETWAIENGFLTPTLKIKRSALEDAYGPQAEAWYKAKQKVIWE